MALIEDSATVLIRKNGYEKKLLKCEKRIAEGQ
jgi:hypothetical protein